MSATNGTTNGTLPHSERLAAAIEAFTANVTSMRRDSLRDLFDPRRNVEDEVGAPRLSDTINPEEYLQFYDRDAIAARVVEVYPKECWQTQPSVYETEDGEEATPFEVAWDALGRQTTGLPDYYQDEEGSPILAELKTLDILCGIGHHGAGLFGLDDGRPLHEPAQPRPGQKLLFFRAFPEAQAVVIRWESDPKSPRHGMPLAYNVTLNDPREDIQTGLGQSVGTHQVHWTRILHVADTWHQAHSSKVYAAPRMRPVWNNLLGLHKMYAGDPEAFWKNSLMKFFLETHPQLGGDVRIDRQGLRDQLEPFINGYEQFFSLMGMSAKPIAPVVADPTAHLAAQIEAICIKLGCPVRIFKGSERGELASSQDDDAWNDRLKERQQSFITPHLIRPFVNRLIWLGVLPQPSGFSVYWPDLTSQSEADSASVAAAKVGAIVQYVGGNAESVLPPHRLLNWLGEDDESAAAILDEATVANGDDSAEAPGLPEAPAVQEEFDEDDDDLGLNCGGKGGKPGRCKKGGTSGGEAKDAPATPAKSDKAATKTTPKARTAAPAPKKSAGGGKKPAAAKVKAPPDKVAKINAKIEVAKKKLDGLKAELKAAKLEAAAVKTSAKQASQKSGAGKGPTKADVAAKESASKVQAVGDHHVSKAQEQVSKVKSGSDRGGKYSASELKDMPTPEQVKADVKAAIGKSSPHKVAKEMGISRKFKSSADAYKAIEQKVMVRVGMVGRILA